MRDDPLYHHTVSELDYRLVQVGVGFGSAVGGSDVQRGTAWHVFGNISASSSGDSAGFRHVLACEGGGWGGVGGVGWGGVMMYFFRAHPFCWVSTVLS